jgi:uncharacterized protein with HEPN domain
MKKNELSDIVYLDHILDYISDVEMILSSSKRGRIEELAAIRAIEVIGEASNNISDFLRIKNSDVPWRQIIDMRNLLIHGYFEVDIKEIWDTCENDIPVLKSAIIRMKKDIEDAN